MSEEHEECEGCQGNEMILSPAHAAQISAEDVIEMLENAACVMGRIQRLTVTCEAAMLPVQTEAIRGALERIQSLFSFVADVAPDKK